MFNFLVSLVIASLLIPSGFDFLAPEKINNFLPPAQQEQNNIPIRLANNSLGIQTTAKSILVVDEASGAVLFAKNQHTKLPVASLTKLMTALVFLENNPGWDKTVIITEEDRQDGGIVYLLPGEEAKAKDLFYLTLVASSNEAALALARFTALKDFVSAMNAMALELEMLDTHFVEPTGLDAKNISSPGDLIKLAKVVFNQPEILSATTLSEYKFTILNSQKPRTAINTNQLLESFLNRRDYNNIFAKTGHLEEVGYNLLMKIEKVKGPALFLVLLGAESQSDRWQESKGVVDWIFRNYQWLN